MERTVSSGEDNPQLQQPIPEKQEKTRRITMSSPSTTTTTILKPVEDDEGYDRSVSDDVSFSDDDADTAGSTPDSTGGSHGTLTTSSGGERKKKSWSTRTKQGLGNSAVGKALFNKFVDKETKKLIHALTVLVEKDKDKKTAKKMKADIFRIAVKVIVLHEEKYVSTDDFSKLRGSFRRICSSMKNGYRTGVIDADTAGRISELIHNFASGIKDIIGKLVSSSTIERIDNMVNYLGATDFLVRTSKLKEFDTVAYVLAYYLQET